MLQFRVAVRHNHFGSIRTAAANLEGLSMISYHAYKLIHLTGVFLLLLSLGGQLVVKESLTWRKHLKVGHGFGLLLILVAGFGLLARLGVSWPWPVWICLKLIVWIFLGVTPLLLRRGLSSGKVLWWIVLIFAGFGSEKPNHQRSG